MPAAAGLGMPMKYRLSVLPAWTLNRASRNAAAATNRNAAVQPSRPSELRPQPKARIAGAMPNDTMSAIESNCTPNSVAVPVIRAMRPSSMSSTTAMPMSGAAVSNSPRMA